MKTPGIKSKSFVISLYDNYFEKGDIFISATNEKVIVTKVYKYNWYRKILNFFGMPFKLFNCVKVKEVDKQLKIPFDQ